MKNKWYDNARRLMAEKRITQDDLRDTFKVKTRGAVGHYLTGRREPSIIQLTALSKKLGCSLSSLIDNPTDEEPFPQNATFLGSSPRSIPLISWVQAEAWCEAIDNFAVGDAEDWLPCPVKNCSRYTFALRVKGDSMTAEYGRSYPEGVIIYVDPMEHVTNGCRVIAKLTETNEVTFKEWQEDAGRYYLKPLNRRYQMQEVPKDIHICGVIIGSYMPE